MATRKRKVKNNPIQTVFTRFLFIVALFVIWIGVIGVRLVHLQVNQSDWLREKAQGQRRDESKTKMLRGSIFDRSSHVLALSVKVKSLYTDPTEIEDVQATVKRLALALKVNPTVLTKDIQDAKQKGKRFLWLARKLDEESVVRLNDALKQEGLKKLDEPRFPGLHWKEEQKRSYPNGSLAAHVIGFSDGDDIGRAGIETSQESNLKGAIVERWRERDRLGRVYDESEIEREPPNDVVLTISNSIQFKVEEALKTGVENAKAKSGMAVVLDPRTGEILAMANYPTFDPNNLNAIKPELYANRAIQDTYAPGSVFKIVTYGGAVQEKLVSVDGQIDCSRGFIEVAGHRFEDPHATGTLSYPDAFAVSSNVAAIKTGLQLGNERFYGYARRFGFGAPTGIDLPSESRGQIRSPQSWNADSLASMSIGYEIGVTALQSAVAFATIANDGVKITPHVVKEIKRADGTVVPTSEIQKVQVVSPETARGLRLMMQRVVLKGTGRRAQLNGYTSAGKTGTAWKYDPKLKKINENKYVSSFIGMAPAEHPSVVIAIILDEPQVGARDGGHVSAPIFQSIAEQILPELGVAPDGNFRNTTAENAEEISETKAAKTTGDKNEKPKAATSGKEKPNSDSDKEESPQKKNEVRTQAASADTRPRSEIKNKSSTQKIKGKT